MLEKVKQVITEYQMCPKGCRVVVGVSGGADSVALLHILCGLRQIMGVSLTAVHIHHGLRGQEADRDAAFVKEICGQWEIPHKAFYYDVRKEAEIRGLGEEEAGRILRYDTFRKEAGEKGRIAVAHHANDQAETILMHLCRGAGLKGLVGMAPLREGIIRPLLFCTREEIEQYCNKNNLPFCQDSTNEEEVYTRNRVRRLVLPLLEEMYPSAAVHMAKTASILQEDADFLEKQAEELFLRLASVDHERIRLKNQELHTLHPAMKKRVLQKAMAYLGGYKDISAAHWESLADLADRATGKEIHLPHKVVARREYAHLILEKEGQQFEEPKDFCYPLEIGKPLWITEGGFWIETSLFYEKGIENTEDGCTNVFDYDKIKHTLFCRNRREGDWMMFSGGHKKLKKYFIDQKIPRGERAKLPLLAVEEEVLWMIGERVSSAYGVDEDTKRCLMVRIRRGTEQ